MGSAAPRPLRRNGEVRAGVLHLWTRQPLRHRLSRPPTSRAWSARDGLPVGSELQRAVGRALMLAAQGKRQDGKWVYGTVNAQDFARSEQDAMRKAGVLIDHDILSNTPAGSD